MGVFRLKTSTFAASTVLVGALALAGCSAPAGTADGTQNTTPLPSTTVSAPGGGSIDEVVPEASPAPTTTVAPTSPADVGSGVVASIVSTENVDVTAETPGEQDGTAVAVTVELRNGGTTALDPSGAFVSVTAAGGILGQPTTARPSEPFGDPIAPGASGRAVYVFMLPADQRTGLEVTVQYAAGATVALFAG